MLCQLVCVDRRYQRMNCFNIRELQGNLKRKFFSDLVNSNDHRELLNNTMIGLRFKTNNLMSLNSDVFSFYQYGTDNNVKSRSVNFLNSYLTFEEKTSPVYNLLNVLFNNSINNMLIERLTLKTPSFLLHQLLLLLNELEIQIFRIISRVRIFSLFNLMNYNPSLHFTLNSFLNFNFLY